MMPPLMTVGSRPAASSIAAHIEVVVVLPCVPPTAIDHLRRISSASISARRTTGRCRSRAARSSGLSGFTALETTTTPASPRFSGRCPIIVFTPSAASRLTFAFSARSEPWTW